jgi:hypothetical protein
MDKCQFYEVFASANGVRSIQTIVKKPKKEGSKDETL